MKRFNLLVLFSLVLLSLTGYSQQRITTKDLTGAWDVIKGSSHKVATITFFDSGRYSMEYSQRTTSGASPRGTYDLEEKGSLTILTMKDEAPGIMTPKGNSRWLVKLPHKDTIKIQEITGSRFRWKETTTNTATWARRVFLINVTGDTLRASFLGQSFLFKDTTELAGFLRNRKSVIRTSWVRVLIELGSYEIINSILGMLKEGGYRYEVRITVYTNKSK